MRCFRQKHLNLIKYKSHQPQNCDFQCNITLGQWLFLLFGLVTHHSIRLARMSHTPNLPCSLDFLITVSGTFNCPLGRDEWWCCGREHPPVSSGVEAKQPVSRRPHLLLLWSDACVPPRIVRISAPASVSAAEFNVCALLTSMLPSDPDLRNAGTAPMPSVNCRGPWAPDRGPWAPVYAAKCWCRQVPAATGGRP